MRICGRPGEDHAPARHFGMEFLQVVHGETKFARAAGFL